MKKLKSENRTVKKYSYLDLLERPAEDIAFNLLPFFDKCNTLQKQVKRKYAIETLLLSIDNEAAVMITIRIENKELSWNVGASPKYQNNMPVLKKINDVFKIALGTDVIDAFK